MVLAAVVLGGAGLAFRTGLDASRRIRERADLHGEARAALDLLAADLSEAFLSGVNPSETYFLATEPDPDSQEPFLSFTTLSYRRSRPGGPADGARSDAVAVEYSLEPPPPGTAPEGTRMLIRRERWLTETGEGETEVACERVADLRIRYGQGGGSYQDNWSAAPSEDPKLQVYDGQPVTLPDRRLPRAVEITLTLLAEGDAGNQEGDARPRVYHTVVAVGADGVAPFEPEVVPRPQQPRDGQEGQENRRGGDR